MANISPSTTIGSLPSDMTIKELAKQMKRMGFSFEEDDDDLDYATSPYAQKSPILKGMNQIVTAVEKIGENIKGMDRAIMGLLEPWRKVDDASAKYARAIGANVEKMNRMREYSISAVNKDRLGLKYGMSPAELLEAQTNYMKGIGRQVGLDRGDTETLAAITKVFGDASEWYDSFDKLGMSMQGIGEHMGDMFATASKHGLSLSKYSDNVKQGLAMANRYTFKDGLRGMEAMARRATAIRMDMQQVESFAESFSDIDKAISTSAKLQVLGGDFARGADPLGLLNDAIGDMESLQKRFEGFLDGKATFNRATGTADISRYNRLRLQQFAAATGQDFGKVQEITKRKAALNEIEADFRRSASYSEISKNEELADAIRNSAVFKDGEFQIKLGSGYKKLADLNEEDEKELIATTQDQSADIKEIAMHVRSLDEVRGGFGKQLEGVMAKMYNWLGKGIKGLTKFFADGKGSGITQGALHGLGGLIGLGTVAALITHGAGIFTAGKFLGKGVKTFGGGVKGIFRGDIGSSSSKISDFIGRFAKGGAKGAEGAKVVGSKGAQYTTYLRKDGGIGLRDSAGRTLSKTRSAKILESQSKKAVSQASKKAVSQTAKKGVSQTAKKVAIKGAGKMGGKLASGIVKGGGLGIVGAVGNIATDALVESGKMKEGGTGHMLAKTGSSALEGAAMASMVAPFFGPAAPLVVAMGALGGAVVGATKVQKVRNEKTLDTQLQSLGIERKGSYGAKRLSDIDKALQTGKMSDSLRKRLIREGDTDIVNQINAISEQKKKEKEEARKEKEDRRDRMAERLGKIFGGGPRRIGTAHFIVTNGIFEGVKHGTGGRIGASSLLDNPLAKISPVGVAIRGAREIGRKIRFRKGNDATHLAEELRRTKGNEPNSPIKVDISGTLNLKTPKGENIDIMGEIKRNPALLTELTQYVVKELNKQQNGGYKVDRVFGNNPIR